MNNKQAAPAEKRRYPGRLFLWLGVLAAVAGPVIYTLQVEFKSLQTPWYVPILATLGALPSFGPCSKAERYGGGEPRGWRRCLPA